MPAKNQDGMLFTRHRNYFAVAIGGATPMRMIHQRVKAPHAQPLSPKATPAENQANSSGFTLVELLVVIGIIALLIAILMPALRKARESALATQCMANMRQMGLAVQTYVSESKGYLPPYQLTTGPLWAPNPYFFQYLPAFYQQGVPGVMICPSDNLIDAFTGTGMRGAYPRLKDQNRVDVYYSYAINRDLPKRITPYYTKPPIARIEPEYFNPSTLTKIRTPSECAFLLETGSTAAISYSTIYYGTFYYRFNHQGGKAMNVLMCDGHCEWKSASQILTANPVNVADTTAWPTGFRQFWFGQGDANGPVWYP